MKKYLTLTLCFVIVAFSLLAQPESSQEPETEKAYLQFLQFSDSLNKALKYQKGEIKLKDIAILNVPENFKFLDKVQSKKVLEDLWGNPPDETILGMLFPEWGGPLNDSSYAFAITFDEMGYVKDDDAKDMDYNKLLKEIRADEPEINKERAKEGYESIHMVGWAQKPYYDNERKVLHWAKALQFGDAEQNTLNYDVRVLGRKGVLSLNAIANIEYLDMVKQDIPEVLSMASFTPGNRYEDFNSSTDEIAAYTVGGLVAGKVLAKTGFFALLLKGWKFILIGIVAIGGAIKKFVFGKKETPTEEMASNETEKENFGKVNEA